MATKICRLRHGDADRVIFDSHFLFAGAMTHRYLDDNFLRPGWEVNGKGRPVVTNQSTRLGLLKQSKIYQSCRRFFRELFVFSEVCSAYCILIFLLPPLKLLNVHQGNKNNYGNCKWELTCNGGIFITFRLREHGLLHNTFETIGANDKISFNGGTALL
jgi:hypothetical protein